MRPNVKPVTGHSKKIYSLIFGFLREYNSRGVGVSCGPSPVADQTCAEWRKTIQEENKGSGCH